MPEPTKQPCRICGAPTAHIQLGGAGEKTPICPVHADSPALVAGILEALLNDIAFWAGCSPRLRAQSPKVALAIERATTLLNARAEYRRAQVEQPAGSEE